MEEVPTLTVAEKYYANHKVRVASYQKANPKKMSEKALAYNQRIKAERPEKYAEVLAQKRKYYLEVTKPKKEAKKKGALPPSEGS
jgi:hypothetical protein